MYDLYDIESVKKHCMHLGQAQARMVKVLSEGGRLQARSSSRHGDGIDASTVSPAEHHYRC